MVMAGAFVYFQVQKTSGYPDYHVNVYLNYTKGNITVDYGHNSINSIVVPSKAWFNVSLKAYSNYSYSFYQNNTPLYFNYSGLNNSGFYTGFLDKNVTVSLNFMGTDLNVPDIHKFNITLTGVPSGTGYYQQLLTIDPSTYGINPQGSNVLFYASNGTPVYAWLQSINSTSASFWIKNFNGSSTINMQVLPSFENLFSANGYLGEAPQLSSTYAEYDNGKYVFPVYYDFINTTEAIGWGDSSGGAGGENYIINDGLSWNVNNTTRFFILSPYFIYNQNNSIADEYVQSTVWELDFTVSSSVNGAIDWVGNSGNSYAHARVYGSTYGTNNVFNYETNLTNGQILGENLGVGKFYVNNKDVYNATAGLSGNKFNWYFSSYGSEATNGYVPYVFVSDIGTNDAIPTFTIGTGNTITIPNEPTYQQLLTISNPSKYGINTAGSNEQFTAANGTLLYAWVQSINNTSMQVWIKNYANNKW